MTETTIFPAGEYYRALFQHARMNSVLVIDLSGIILEANQAFLHSFGYETEDIVGHNFSILFSEEDQKKDLPLREIRTVLDEGQAYDNNYLVNKNKILTWVSGESILLVDDQGQKRIVKIIQNIHAQKESEFSIIRLNNFNENILSTIEDGVIVLDEQWRILKSNHSFTEMFRFSGQDISTIDVKTFVGSFDINAELTNALTNIFLRGAQTARLQLQIDTSASEGQIFDVSCARLAEKGEQTRALIIFHDITSQKQLERHREDILNFVAHEFRNPLTSLMLNISLLHDMVKEKQMKECEEFIVRTQANAQRMKRLINELYDTTKLISGNAEPERTIFSLDGLIDETVASIGQLHSMFSITRTKTIAPSVSVLADRDNIIQVVTNYLTNAIKYSDGSYVIDISTVVTNDSVIISVTDHGKGIPSKDIPYIFDRFYRVEKTKNLEGLGLGLFLSRQIIAAHGGRTWVESEYGKGSTFYFSLPLHSGGNDSDC